LTLVMLLAAAPGYVILALHGNEARRDARGQAMERAVAVARATVLEEARSFAGFLHVLEQVAKGPECRAGDPTACEAYLRTLLEKDRAYSAFAVVTPAGTVRASAVRSGRPVFSVAGAEWLPRAMHTR